MNKTVYNALAQKIEKTVTDLVNYYDTSQVYNKAEIRQLIGAINTLTIAVVASLPTTDISTTTIYLVGPASGTNKYDEYVYVNSAWVQIGDTTIDLSQYVTSANLTTILQSYYTKTAIDALLDSYYTQTEVDTLLDAKQDTLQYDDTPTAASTNMVKSGAIYSALDLRQPKELETPLTIDGTEQTTVEGALGGLTTGLTKAEENLPYSTTRVLTTDTTPYLVRKPINVNEFSGYMHDKLIGGTIAHNQYVREFDNTYWEPYNATYTTISCSSNIITCNIKSTSASFDYMYAIKTKEDYKYFVHKDHKYFYTYEINPSATCNFKNELIYNFGQDEASFIQGVYTKLSKIRVNTSTGGGADSYRAGLIFPINPPSDFYYKVRNMNIIDLTQMLGPEIADYLYSIEAANPGSGVTKLQEWGFCTDSYYDYNAGELLSINTSGHRIVKFNIWDEQWVVGSIGPGGANVTSTTAIRSANYCPLLENHKYRIYSKITNVGNFVIYFYDNARHCIPYTGAGAYQDGYSSDEGVFYAPQGATCFRIRSTTNYGPVYKNDISISFYDAEKLNVYEPYQGITYPINPIDIRGIPKLNTNNNLYYDGDTYTANGTINRKYGIVDLGSLTNWAKDTTAAGYRFKASYSQAKSTSGSGSIPNIICPKYITATPNDTWNKTDSCISINNTETASILIVDNNYSDVASLKTALSGVYLVYELKTSTKESVSPFADPQYLKGATLEQYIDTRTIPISPGHETQYMGIDYDAEVLMLPSMPVNDGDYVLSTDISGGQPRMGWNNISITQGDPIANTNFVNETFDLHYHKLGKLVHVFGNFTIDTATSSSSSADVLFTGFPKAKGGMKGTSSQYVLMLMHSRTAPYNFRCFFDTSGRLVSRYYSIPTDLYFIDCFYFTDD